MSRVGSSITPVGLEDLDTGLEGLMRYKKVKYRDRSQSKVVG